MAVLLSVLGCADAKPTAKAPPAEGSPRAEAPKPPKAPAAESPQAEAAPRTPEAPTKVAEHDEPTVEPAAEPANAEGPPAPEGVPLPRWGVVVEADDGGGRAAYHWKGIVTADPSDPGLQSHLAAATSTGKTLTPNAALLERYRQEVSDAGLSPTGLVGSPSFHFVTGGSTPWAVFVRTPADDPHGPPPDPSRPVADDNGPLIEIVVGTPGG